MRISEEIGSWEELFPKLWSCEDVINAIHEQGRGEEAYDLIESLSEDWDLVQLNDFVRFDIARGDWMNLWND